MFDNFLLTTEFNYFRQHSNLPLSLSSLSSSPSPTKNHIKPNYIKHIKHNPNVYNRNEPENNKEEPQGNKTTFESYFNRCHRIIQSLPQSCLVTIYYAVYIVLVIGLLMTISTLSKMNQTNDDSPSPSSDDLLSTPLAIENYLNEIYPPHHHRNQSINQSWFEHVLRKRFLQSRKNPSSRNSLYEEVDSGGGRIGRRGRGDPIKDGDDGGGGGGDDGSGDGIAGGGGPMDDGDDEGGYLDSPQVSRIADISNTGTNVNISNDRLIVGFKLIGKDKVLASNKEEYTVHENSDVLMLLFGTNFSSTAITRIGFTQDPPDLDTFGDNSCRVRTRTSVPVLVKNRILAITKFHLTYEPGNTPYYLCYSNNTGKNFQHYFYYYAASNDESWSMVYVRRDAVPFWLQIGLIVVLLLLSGLFSGLNLGLMSMDKNELQVIERCGTLREKMWSRSITPVRQRGNYLLCTLLLGNVMVNSTLTIFMDELTSGLYAVIGSTLCIVVFGEIIPQAICTRHGLYVGANSLFITYLFMGITFPLSYPISLLLDATLGEEICTLKDRERLMEYIRITKDYNRLEQDEMNIISGALKFKNTKVVDVMTPIDDVFMLSYDTALTFDNLCIIHNTGYSRIPVYENERDNIVGLLHAKDLLIVNADNQFPLSNVLEFYKHPLFLVDEDVTLDQMFNEFKKGKSHMAIVRRCLSENGRLDRSGSFSSNSSNAPPPKEVLGVITLEDILEEVIQTEIIDETDLVYDNKKKQQRKDQTSHTRRDFFNAIRYGRSSSSSAAQDSKQVTISQQLMLATFCFLTTSVEPFRQENFLQSSLKSLMKKNIFFETSGEPRKPKLEQMSPRNLLYLRGEPANYFIVILEGHARVVVTIENQEYDAGPFCCFGLYALLDHAPMMLSSSSASPSPTTSTASTASPSPTTPPSDGYFVPDFTLFCTDHVIYLKVTREQYLSAKHELPEEGGGGGGPNNNNNDNNNDSDSGSSSSSGSGSQRSKLPLRLPGSSGGSTKPPPPPVAPKPTAQSIAAYQQRHSPAAVQHVIQSQQPRKFSNVSSDSKSSSTSTSVSISTSSTTTTPSPIPQEQQRYHTNITTPILPRTATTAATVLQPQQQQQLQQQPQNGTQEMKNLQK